VIVSASRRTDIPAFFAEWFINRVDAGYCNVPSPFNRNQVSRVSLDSDKVDVIAFWTRHPLPLLSYLDHLDALGFRYYFQFTILNYPRFLDARGPSLKISIQNFRKLATLIGPARVIWRYDPIVLTADTDARFHQENFRGIAEMLRGYTNCSVISFVDIYRKNAKRLQLLAADGLSEITSIGKPSVRYDEMMYGIVDAATSNGMSIQSCAESFDLTAYGIHPGKCIDSQYIADVFGIQVGTAKHKGQRELCGCVTSKDIGMYHSCRFGCLYCYATNSYDLASSNSQIHQPISPSMLGWHE